MCFEGEVEVEGGGGVGERRRRRERERERERVSDRIRRIKEFELRQDRKGDARQREADRSRAGEEREGGGRRGREEGEGEGEEKKKRELFFLLRALPALESRSNEKISVFFLLAFPLGFHAGSPLASAIAGGPKIAASRSEEIVESREAGQLPRRQGKEREKKREGDDKARAFKGIQQFAANISLSPELFNLLLAAGFLAAGFFGAAFFTATFFAAGFLAWGGGG